MTAFPMDETVITIRGGNFRNIANSWPLGAETMTRGIHITRSNVVLDGITMEVTDQGPVGTNYKGFFYVNNAVNVTIQNSQFTGRQPYRSLHGPLRGTYNFTADFAVNIRAPIALYIKWVRPVLAYACRYVS
jgi:hypothetical protein